MAGKLPPRELRVVTRNVYPRNEDFIEGLYKGVVPEGTICQLVGMRARRIFVGAESLIYYEQEFANEDLWVCVWVPDSALRPYDPEEDAPKEEASAAKTQAEPVKPDELPPRGRCTK